MDFNPVHLKHTTVPSSELTALFSISDVCLVSSTRDGMNLVAYEYVACQAERHGVLVLSEFAGCAQSFASGAVISNPWDIEELADSLHEAVTMPEEEKLRRHENLWNYVHKYTRYASPPTRIPDPASNMVTVLGGARLLLTDSKPQLRSQSKWKELLCRT